MDELHVGATPQELIPGSVDVIAQLGRRLQDIAVGCQDAANQLTGLRAGDWKGEAAEAFADALDQEPGKYVRAAEAFREAARAVTRYAATLEEAQQEAREAIALFEDASVRQARMEAETAGAAPAVPVAPAAGDDDIVRARLILDAARERVAEEAELAARILSEAAAAAPNKPGWGKRFLHGASEFFGGVADATWGTGKFLWSVSQVRMVVDPGGWVRDVKGIGAGLVWGVAHPVDFGKAVIDWETWKENPARAAGRLVPDIALALATAGAGAAGRGARAVERAADATEDVRAADRAADAAQKVRAADRAGDSVEEARTVDRVADYRPRHSPAMDEERRLRLLRDWDHGGKVTPNSRKEAEIAEDLEARGNLSHVDRPEGVSGRGDVLDANGRWWDVKGPQSRESVEELMRRHARSRGLPEPSFDPSRPLPGEFDLNDQVAKIRDMVEADRGVILDRRGLNEADSELLRQAIVKEGMSDRVIWYP